MVAMKFDMVLACVRVMRVVLKICCTGRVWSAPQTLATGALLRARIQGFGAVMRHSRSCFETLVY